MPQRRAVDREHGPELLFGRHESDDRKQMLHERVEHLFLRTLDFGLCILREALQVDLRPIVLPLSLKARIRAQDGFGLCEALLQRVHLLPPLVHLRPLLRAQLIQF